ncbi:hypothetical protein PGTUg99_013714 [Puccinia graminis f. sp. tritici]|uniref:Secreted protein n=1 Tax=Puccinia graminis f. sp. tritici TaxID=56615 RepID=A0A5B0QGD3_PUCGR|nr:hypothetical protein PGTUg99_013714 [Puccinia graminis f. sp. tritici]
MQLSNVFPTSLVFLLQGAVTYGQGFGCKGNVMVSYWPNSGCVKMTGMKNELAEVIPAHWNNQASIYECASDKNHYLTEACCSNDQETKWKTVQMAVAGGLGLCMCWQFGEKANEPVEV